MIDKFSTCETSGSAKFEHLVIHVVWDIFFEYYALDSNHLIIWVARVRKVVPFRNLSRRTFQLYECYID